MKNNYEYIIINGVIVGFLTFLLNLLTLVYWHRDGFDLIEVSLMPILAGFYLFIVSLVFNGTFLNNGIKKCLLINIKPLKRIYQVLISLLISLLIFILFDSILFTVNNDISVDYAISLKEMAEAYGESSLDISQFMNLPFSIQNLMVTFIIGLISSFISLIFIKKTLAYDNSF